MKRKVSQFQSKVRPISNQHVNIFYSLKPFYLFSQVFGLQKMSESVSKKFRFFSKVYSILLFLLIFSYQWRVLYERFVYYYGKMKIASVIIDLLIMTPVWISSMFSLSLIIFNYPAQIYRAINNIKYVDDNLLMGSPKIFKKLRLKIIISLIVIIIGTILHYAFDFWVWKGDLRISALFLMQCITELELVEITLHIYLIYDRMNLLNKKLKYDHSFVAVFFRNEICSVKNVIEKEVNQTSDYNELVKLIWLFDRLSDNIEIFNSYFGVQVIIYIIIFIIIKNLIKNIFSYSVRQYHIS